uniref:Alpha-N-acetylglucosaminidase n=1 Tax=Caenorhabditis japonica TaxID=281687 RepID=A0A8R1HLH2_CAEJA
MPRAIAHALLLFALILVETVTGALRMRLPDYDVDSWRRVLMRSTPEWVLEEFQDVRVMSVNENGGQLPKQGAARIEIDNFGRKTVFGSTPTDALYAINAYLRTECLSQISWSNSTFSNSGCRKQANDVINFESKQFRYFGNMCTFSYSFVWWQWPEWERFIDWIALNGFNAVLMPLGQEAIWRDVFLALGVKRDELDEYFTSQAYLAWHRMGNLKGYGGGLSDAQMLNDLNLAKRIIDRLLELGITPILPTFAGFVPDQLETLFPTSKFNRLPCWNHFSRETSCLLSVSPFDPLFQKIATSFLRTQKKMFGDVTSLYSADPFNEIVPKDSSKFDAAFVKQTAQAIYGGCRKVDKNCVWVLQSWTFTYDKWPAWAIKSFLTAIPVGNLLILDLYAEVTPAWQMTSNFYGHNWIWCMLHNFGGSRELRGNLQKLDKSFQLALLNSESNLIGAGLTMEAIDQNYVIYQFMVDRMWSPTPIPLNRWLKSYSESRYSAEFKVSEKFWNLLAATFYNQPDQQNRFHVFLYQRPGFGKKIEYWFDVEETFKQIEALIPSLIHVLGEHPLFREDLNDVMRAVTQFALGNDAILTLSEAYLLEDKAQMGVSCENLMVLFTKLEQYSNRGLGEWIDSAKSIAPTGTERQTFPMMATDILTVWGPNAQNLDYAHREWSGLISGYYGRRWQYFCDWILEHDVFNHTEFAGAVFADVERPFSIL